MLNQANELVSARKAIRKQRQQLDRFALKKAAQCINQQILRHPKVKSAQHIAIYLDMFGEIPTRALMFNLLKQNKQLYLPVICNMDKKLLWQRVSIHQLRNQRFSTHPLGMKQAVQRRGQTMQRLELVLMPLVIFDEFGHRVGMGGGFYDRTLASQPYLPYRLGLAYDFQKSPTALIQYPWDQALDEVCSPTQRWQFKRTNRKAYIRH